MGAGHVPRLEIEDPFEAVGWRVSRPDDEGTLHTEVLRELCDRALPLHVGGAGRHGVTATLQLVDVLQQQVVLASQDDGMALARALQARPVWAAAQLRGLRVQFVLAAACAAREGHGRAPGAAGNLASAAVGRPESFLIQARWPREIYRTSRRQAPRWATGALPTPSRRAVLRFCGGHQLVSTRNLRVLDLSESGCAVMLPAGVVPPPLYASLPRVELELDDTQVILADARVRHVAPAGRNGHRLGCAWENLAPAGQLALRRWLAAAEPHDGRVPVARAASAVPPPAAAGRAERPAHPSAPARTRLPQGKAPKPLPAVAADE